jgi:hypothetical protein
MIDGGFALKADGMEELEGGHGDGALGVVRYRGVPAIGEQLLPVQLGTTASACAKVQRHMVKAIRGDDQEFRTAWVSTRARCIVGVAELNPQPELSQLSSLKKRASSTPTRRNCTISCASKRKKCEHTSIRQSGRRR